MSKKAVIDVGLRIDVKDQLDAIASQIQSMAKSSGKNMSSAMAKEMQTIEDEVSKIKETMDSLAFGKLNAKSFETANRVLMNQIDNLEKRTSALEDGMKALIGTMSESDGGVMVDNLRNISKEMDNLKDNAQSTVNAIKEIRDVSKKNGDSINIIDSSTDLKVLEDELKLLDKLTKSIQKADGLSLDFSSSGFKDAEAEVEKLLDKYYDLEAEIDDFGEINTDKQRKQFNELQKEMVKAASNIRAAVAGLRESGFGSKQIAGSPIFADAIRIEEEQALIDEKFEQIQRYIEKRRTEIRKAMADTGQPVDFKKTDKGTSLTVPIELTPKGKGLATQAERIIAIAQKTIDDKPLEVQFKLVSAYSSKKTNTLLKQFQAEIDDVEDELKREDFQKMFNQLRSDFQKEINIKVSADVKDASKKVKDTIEEIRKSLKEKLRVFPTIEFEEDELKRIQGVLDDISKSLTLTIGDVGLSEKATQKLKSAVENQQKNKKGKGGTVETEDMAKIKELSKSIQSVTEGINRQLNEINSGSLQPIITSLQQIGQLLMVIMQSTSAIPNSVTEITSNIKEMITVMQRGFGLLTNEDLDKMFVNIQKSTDKIKGNLRGDNLTAIKKVLASYQQYVKLGGTRDITEISDKRKDWFKKHANDDVLTSEVEDVDKVGTAVDEVKQKILDKNEKFKEEANVVKSVASEETKALKDVVDVLQQMFENLAQINQKGFDDWKVEDWRRSISDALKAIDDLEIKGSNGEKLESIKIKVEPLIDPVEFSNEVSSALSSVTAEIKVSPSFEPNEFKNEIEKYINSDNATKEIEQLTEDFLELSEAEARLAQSGDLGFGFGSNLQKPISVDEIEKAINLYEKAKNELENLFSFDTVSSFDGFEDKYLGNLKEDILDKISKGILTEEEISKSYEEKYQEAFSNLSRLLPSVDPDQIDSFIKDYINAFDSIEERSKFLHKALSENMDIASIFRKQSSSRELEILLDELENIGKAYKSGEWKSNFISNPSEEINDFYREIEKGSKEGLILEDNIKYFEKVKEILPYIENAYEEIYGKPYIYSEEQLAILSQLDDEKLTLSEILSLWKKLNVQIEKGVLLNGDRAASKTITGDLSNVYFEQLNNMENSIYGEFDTILHSHADGLGTFSPEDIDLILQNWEQGVRKLLLSVDGELQSLDFTSLTKDQAIEFQKAYSDAFAENIANSGKDPFSDNALFSKIKQNTIDPLLKQYGLELFSDNIKSITSLDTSNITNSAIESTKVTQDESDAFGKVNESAKEAAEQKEKFAKANGEVLSSIVESVKGLADETKGFEALNKLIKNLSKEDGMENTIKNLQAIADLLKTEVSDSSILSVLKDIAAQGTDLGDIATLIKASKKEIEKAKKQAAAAQGQNSGGPTIVHNGVKPLINELDKNSDEWKFINEQVEQHKNKLGEVLQIYRKVDGELESYFVKTTKGNKMWFGKDSEDNWIAADQKMEDNVERFNQSKKLFNGIDDQIEKFNQKLDKATKSGKEFTDEFTQEIGKVQSEMIELQAIRDKYSSESIWDEKDIERSEEIVANLKKVGSELSGTFTQVAGADAFDKLLGKISKDLNDNTKMAPELREKFMLLRDSMLQLRESGEQIDKVSFKSLAAEFQHLHEEMLRAGKTGDSFFKSIAKAAKSQTTQFIARYFSLQDWIRYAQQGFEKVKSIDSALTELRKVSDASTSRLVQNFEASSKAAQDLGHSISGVINITADWARLGYSVDDAEKLARITTMFQTVGDNMTTETASQYMISTLQGFQLGVDKAEEITDKYNEVKCWLPLYSKNPYMDRVQLCLF